MSWAELVPRTKASRLSGPWDRLLLGRGLLPRVPACVWDEQPVDIQVHLHIDGRTGQFRKSSGIKNQQKRRLLRISRDNG